MQATAGTAAATFTQSSAGAWLAMMVTFKPGPVVTSGQTLLVAADAPAPQTSSDLAPATSLLSEDLNEELLATV